MSVFRYQVYQSQGFDNKCGIARLAQLLTFGKLDIKRWENGILIISLPVGSSFKLVIMT